MTPEQADFYNREILQLETTLLAHPLGGLFSGSLYDMDGEPITGLALPDMGETGLDLNSAEMGRLFMAPDESVVSVLRLREQGDGTPAGYVRLGQDRAFQSATGRDR